MKVKEQDNLPNHIAIIMDGNRRWAKQNSLITGQGHKKGAETLKELTKYANSIGLKYLTVFAFSTENWKRSEDEVTTLMKLLGDYLTGLLEKDTQNIKIKFIGNIDKLEGSLYEKIQKIESNTKNNTGLVLNIALNYGGRDEIVRAVKTIAKNIKNEDIEIEDINEDLISNHMYTKDIPDPDLLIRTSGELRTSNFLPWQIVYTEFLFFDKYWPEFTSEDLNKAIKIYNDRNRKFGGNNKK